MPRSHARHWSLSLRPRPARGIRELRCEEVAEPNKGGTACAWSSASPRRRSTSRSRALLLSERRARLHAAGNDFDVVAVDGDRRFTSIVWEAVDVGRVEGFW